MRRISPTLQSICCGPGTVPRVASVSRRSPHELPFLFIDVETKAQSGYERHPHSHGCAEAMEQGFVSSEVKSPWRGAGEKPSCSSLRQEQ